jgi:hypothetical protein
MHATAQISTTIPGNPLADADPGMGSQPNN